MRTLALLLAALAQVTVIPSGRDPSWSPSGEWIAYYDRVGTLSVVHPDGSGISALGRLRRGFPWLTDRRFADPPVWSPDSTGLIVNEAADDETGRTLIHRIAIERPKFVGIRGKGVTVLGMGRVTPHARRYQNRCTCGRMRRS